MTSDHPFISLNADETALLPVYLDKWLKIGLSTEPLDFKAAKKAVKKAYKLAGLEPPTVFYRFESPQRSKLGSARAQSDEHAARDRVAGYSRPHHHFSVM